MRERDVGTAVAAALAWAGAAAFLICLLVRKIAPYPRWDLLACLACSAVAFLAWWLRATGRWRSRLGGVAPPAFGLKMGRRWWPPLRSVCVFFAAWGLFGPFFLLGISAGENTPQLTAITEHDYRYTPVTITKIHHKYRNQSKSGTTYTYAVTVEAPGPGGHGRTLRLTGEAQSSSGNWSTGTRLSGLYAPDAPSLGIILTPRRHLDSLLGGPASPGEMALLAAFSAIPLILFLLLVRSGAKEWGEPLTPESAFGDSPARRLRVRIAGGTAGPCAASPTSPKASRGGQKERSEAKPRLTPALRLSSSEGSRDLFIDRCLDPQALADALEYRAGWLYWAPTAEEPPNRCVAACSSSTTTGTSAADASGKRCRPSSASRRAAARRGHPSVARGGTVCAVAAGRARAGHVRIRPRLPLRMSDRRGRRSRRRAAARHVLRHRGGRAAGRPCDHPVPAHGLPAALARQA